MTAEHSKCYPRMNTLFSEIGGILPQVHISIGKSSLKLIKKKDKNKKQKTWLTLNLEQLCQVLDQRYNYTFM